MKQEGTPTEKTASGTIWSPLHLQNSFSGEILLHSRSKPRAGNSSSWHPSSGEHSRASSRQMHWRRYGYINLSQQRIGLISLWEQFMDWLCGNKGHNQPNPVWSLLPSGTGQQHESPATVHTGLDALTSGVNWESRQQCNQWQCQWFD